MSDIISQLQQLKGRVVIQWIPGHSNISQNDLADKSAKEIAQNWEAAVSPLSYNTARSIIKKEIKDPSPTHPTEIKTYENLSSQEEGKSNQAKKVPYWPN